MAGNVETMVPGGSPRKPGKRSPVSIDLEEEINSPPLKSNRVYSGSVSTTNSIEDVLEGVLVVRPTRKWKQTQEEQPPRQTPTQQSFINDANLGKRYSGFLSLAYLNNKCLEINQEHTQFEALICSHFDQSQKRLQQIKDRLSSHPEGEK